MALALVASSFLTVSWGVFAAADEQPKCGAPNGCKQSVTRTFPKEGFDSLAALKHVERVRVHVKQVGDLRVLNEAIVQRYFEDKLRQNGIAVAPFHTMQSELEKEGTITPLIVLRIGTICGRDLVSHDLFVRVYDWIEPHLPPERCMFATTFVFKTFGFSHIDNGQQDLLNQADRAISAMVNEIKLARAAAPGPPSAPRTMKLTASELEVLLSGRDERLTLSSARVLYVGVKIGRGAARFLDQAQVERQLYSELSSLGIKVSSADEGLAAWEKTGILPRSLGLDIKTTDNGQGITGFQLYLTLNEGVVRKSHPSIACYAPIFTLSQTGASSTSYLYGELPRCLNGFIKDFAGKLKEANLPVTTEHVQAR